VVSNREQSYLFDVAQRRYASSCKQWEVAPSIPDYGARRSSGRPDNLRSEDARAVVNLTQPSSAIVLFTILSFRYDVIIRE